MGINIRSTMALALTAVSCAMLRAHADGPTNFVELRIYESHPGERDRFLQFFEDHFVESQEVFDMRIWGQFRDLVVPTHFVWMRGYETMEERASGLMNFYTSVVWREYGPIVRDMLATARHVHLLEPVDEVSGFDSSMSRQEIATPPFGSGDWEAEAGVVVAEVYLVGEEDDREAVIASIRNSIGPARVKAGGAFLGLFRTSDEPNNFPALHLIEDEDVIVWFGSFASQTDYEAAVIDGEDDEPAIEPFETFVLAPGRRSRLFHRQPPESEPETGGD